MSNIIECPACTTRYKMNKAIPEGGRSVKCARCGHQWRLVPDEPEELTDTLEYEGDTVDSAIASDGRGVFSSHETAPASEVSAPSWEARRGHLAAAIASMSDAQAGGEEQASDPDVSFAQAREWVTQAPRYDDFAASQSGMDTDAAASGDDAMAQHGQTPFAARPGAWTEDTAWAADAAAEDGDPEISVREALKAAMEDQAAEDGEGPFRPIFTDARYEDTVLSGGLAAKDGEQDPDDSPATSANEEFPGVAQIAFSTREGHFPPAGTISLKETAEQAAATGSSQDTESFESDIVGMFSQRPQTKRSFGPGLGGRREDSDFADQDGGSSEQGDDRYLADGPLDADAAALQAAIEGSLRESHASETRTGGGGLALAAAWAVFLSVLSGVSLAFVNFRTEISETLPGTASLYRAIGFSVQERVVDFGAVTYRWTVAEGKPMIEVTGQIINLTDHEITVPRVLVQVHDKESTDTVKANATVRSEPLAARESADFTLEFLAPPKSIAQIELAFVEAE